MIYKQLTIFLMRFFAGLAASEVFSEEVRLK